MRTLPRFMLCALAACLASPVASAAAPPVAPVRPVVDDYFGTKVTDNYRWMENLKDPEMQKWMKAQADYTRTTLDALPGYAALLKPIDELNTSEHAHVGGVQIVGGRYYSLRKPANAQSPKLYVRDGVKGEDKLLIDPEEIPGNDQSHWSIDDYRPSPDGQYIAYLLARGGSGRGRLRVFDVRAGKDLPQQLANVVWAAPWWRDNHSFFYTSQPPLARGAPATDTGKNERVYLHVIGQPYARDVAIIGIGASAAFKLDPDDILQIVTSPTSHYAIACVQAGTDPRMRVYAAPFTAIKDGTTAWRAIAPTYTDQFIGGIETPAIGLAGDTLYWLSRKNAPRGEILKLDLSRADSKPEIVVSEGELPISEVYASKNAIWWRVSDVGVNSIHRLLLTTGARPEALKLPYPGDVADVSTDADGDGVALQINSWLRSPTYLGIESRTGTLGDDGLQPAAPFAKPEDLTVEEVRVKSWDGTQVPLSIVHKKGMRLDGSHRVLLQGYGAYGISLSPRYSPDTHHWVDRDFILAFAHVRGGGELGEAWHQAGMKNTKPNTWKDYIACAQYLIDHRYTNPHKLVGFGASAGGIMIGRAIEERPDLFAAAIMGFPAADMLRFQNTASGPHNIHEFGDARTPDGFKALYAMSPYAHVKDGVKYPAVLVETGINDQRVAAWIPAKFAARLQAATASGKPVLLRVDYDAGHGLDPATRRQLVSRFADQLAFALWQTGDPAFQPKH